MKLLITGGLGYVGGRLAQALAASRQHEIVIGTRRASGSGLAAPGIRVARVDWNSAASLDAFTGGVEAIVHAAGINAADSAADVVAALEFNGLATARLARAAVRHRARRFIYLSTAHVYGSPLVGTITEGSCAVAAHPYATSHRAGEDVVRAMHQRGEIEGVVVRLSNSYGAPASAADCWTLLVNDLCRQAATTDRLVLTSSGRQRRNFIPMSDVCRAIQHLLEMPAGLLDDGVFNVGGSDAQVIEMAELVAARVHALTGRHLEIVTRADNAADTPLDYSGRKLASTGFETGGRERAVAEIDALIRYCVEHAG